MTQAALTEEQYKGVTCSDEELYLRACVGICDVNTRCKAVKAVLLEVATFIHLVPADCPLRGSP